MLTSDKGYSNVFHADGGNAAFSVMANTLRGVYDSDVLIAAANSFTGSVLAADYTEKHGGLDDHAEQSARVSAAR